MSVGLHSVGTFPVGLERSETTVTNTNVSPAAASVVVTGYAPTITRTANQSVSPAPAAVTATGYAPTIARTANQSVSPAAANVTVTGYAPTISRTANQIVTPGAASVTATGYAPTISRTTGLTITPGAASVVVTGYAPTIARTAHQSVSPAPASVIATGYAPTITQAAPPADPRYARPDADVSTGLWFPSSGSDLWDMIDEPSADSTDFIYTETAGAVCEVALNPVVDPGTSSGQVVRYQAWSESGDGIIVRLYQGSTIIAAWSHASLPTVATIFAQTLSPSECDSLIAVDGVISNLRFKFEAQ